MAYSTANPPTLRHQDIGNKGPSQWVYSSADPIGTVNDAGYISNGAFLGMKVGDQVTVRDTATPTTSLCSVVSANATTGAVDLTDGTAVVQTNTD